MSNTDVNNHKVVSSNEWLEARKQLLREEKEFTRLRDQLSRQRRELPWVKVEKNYVFDGVDGKKTLAGLFEGKSQLVIYHFMFGPAWERPCRACSFWADSFNGIGVHLKQRDVTMIAISRAPSEKLEAFKRRMGWTFKWYSSANNDFNYDYRVSFSPEALDTQTAIDHDAKLPPLNRPPTAVEVDYNYGKLETETSDLPGVSVFYQDGKGNIYHTYSAYARGIDILNATYHYLDLVPKGRDEDELPWPMAWVRFHDNYDQ
jgi:predicted dithiol-disulfide oxidoreductase (DUF899 family)